MNTALFGDTITLYNRYRLNREDAWQRTVIHGVQVRERIEKTVDANGLHVANSVSVTIPVDADAGGRHYLPPALFTESAHKGNYWSLDAAHNLDLIVIGACDKELTDDYTLDNLQKDYGYATVKAVADNTSRPHLKHWKVTAV